MVTKEKVRTILENEGEDYSDEELEKIIYELQRQAKIALKEFKANIVKTKIRDGDQKV